MRIQIADANDPRLALGHARDEARAALAATQEVCGCWGGATCPACVEAAGVAARLASEYQALYALVTLTGPASWWDLPTARWAFKGDAAQTEH